MRERQRLDDESYSFITLEPSNIQEAWNGEAPAWWTGVEAAAVDPRMYYPNPLGGDATLHQVITGAFTDGVKPGSPIHQRYRKL
jgi:hypothetical protein